jgi:hypothetical protein
MIPRLHPRGASFKGACNYILHDPEKQTSDRVAWVTTRNLASSPEWAWHEMYGTWAAQDQLKKASGHDLRGRKNAKPVLHYTLSWALSEQPTQEHMREAALGSLKAMGLHEHEALIAAHNDKEHTHLHIVVNTVHPQTGLTAPMKFSKLELSKWAEAYELQHGLHCEERIKNNEERRKVAKERKLAAEKVLTEGPDKAKPLEPPPFVPVKHYPVPRSQWLDKKDIVDRMKRLRAEMDLHHKVERNATWQRQKKERDAVDANTKAAVTNTREHLAKKYRPHWRDLYRVQRKEMKHVEGTATHPFERAVYVFSQRERLGHGKSLTLRQVLPLIANQGKLLDAVERMHGRERRQLAQMQKVEQKGYAEKIWEHHERRFDKLIEQQAAERAIERAHHHQLTRAVTFQDAKASLLKDLEPIAPAPEVRRIRQAPAPAIEQARAPAASPPEIRKAFAKVAPPPEPEAPEVMPKFVAEAPPVPPAPSRSAQVKRDMEVWKKRNEDKDLGREL